MSAKKRFRPLWVVLHWLMALLVFITFGIGLTSLTKTHSSSEKYVPLFIHMILGIAILLIVTARYILRLAVFKPARRAAPEPQQGLRAKKQPLLDQMNRYVHPLLYFFTALMAGLGLAIALPADLFAKVYTHFGGPLPVDFYIYPARSLHANISVVLMLLVAQHVLVAVYHQFLKGENFLGRMWFTKK